MKVYLKGESGINVSSLSSVLYNISSFIRLDFRCHLFYGSRSTVPLKTMVLMMDEKRN
jgi:hypothetical protein